MIAPLTIPSTSTLSPFVMALAEIELVPFRYSVESVLLTLTFWPADVKTTKLDADKLSTVPATPPVAGEERALDLTLPDMLCPGAGMGVVVTAPTTTTVALKTINLLTRWNDMN